MLHPPGILICLAEGYHSKVRPIKNIRKLKLN
jgi:hypothetical protein